VLINQAKNHSIAKLIDNLRYSNLFQVYSSVQISTKPAIIWHRNLWGYYRKGKYHRIRFLKGLIWLLIALQPVI